MDKKQQISELWTRENITWLAGLLEGEGYFGVNGRRPTMALGMTDEDVVRKAARIGGVGHVRGPYRNPSSSKLNHKPTWHWKVSSGAHVYALCAALYPFMGKRRAARIQEVMDAFRNRTRGSPPHGVRAKYLAGCRCDPCRLAHRDYSRLYERKVDRKKKRAEVADAASY